MLWSKAIFFISLVNTVYGGISCLVLRRGYGLVAEECPDRAVGCRIKVDKDSIQWYEYSRLYDRNQLVCVLPGEYTYVAGCNRKKAGSVRCWCGGRDQCNDPETSRALYRQFERGGNDAVQKWQATYNYDERRANEVVTDEGGSDEENTIEEIVTQPAKSTEPTTTSTITSTIPSTTTSTTTSSKRIHVATRRPHHTHKGRVSEKLIKSPILTKKISTSTVAATTTTTTTTTTTSTTTTSTTKTRKDGWDSAMEETRRRISEEIKEEDYRLSLILQDEEREMLMDADEREKELGSRASQERKAAEEKDKKAKGRKEDEAAEMTEWEDGEEDDEAEEEDLEEEETMSGNGYGFRRKHMLQRRREKELRRQAEEERLAKVERDQAEERERKAREKEQQVDDYLDGIAPFGLAQDGERSISSGPSISHTLLITMLLYLLNR